MPLVYPTGYYDRTDPTKYYDKHLFRANYVLQGAELNEIQSEAHARIRGMGDALFKDGAVIKNAQIAVNPTTGETQCEAGVIYLAGKLYGIPAATITLPITGTVAVGIYLVSSIIDETADATLRDPAITAGNYLEPGAHRLKVLPQWGSSADTPPADSAFFSVYTVVDALVQPHAPPPDLSPVALAISRYDVQSTGSNYVSRGLDVKRLDDVNNQQQYLLTEGLARIGGLEMESRHAIRSFYAATPDLETTNAESHAATSDPQTVTLNHTPVAEVQLVLITKTVTSENVSRSQTPGGQDSLAHDSIVAVSLVQQGGTTYNVTSDYVLTGDQIDWAPGGAEPAGGSTYQVTYTYTAVYPEEAGILGAVTDTTAVINGATNGTTILIGYTWKMPRYDRLCINAFGDVVYVTGVSHPSQPVPPPIPKTLLPLATLYQTWNAATRTCTPDAVRMVSMAELSVLERRIDDLYALVGDHRLAINANARDPSTKRGLFVDAFYDDDLRDTGLDQTAIILNETLTLAADWTITFIDLTSSQTLTTTTPVVVIEQPLFSATTLINPFQSFAPMPGRVTLTPATDFWTLAQDLWLNPLVNRVGNAPDSIFSAALAQWYGRGAARMTLSGDNHRMFTIVTNSEVTTVASRQIAAEYLRPIAIRFDVTGFGAGEILTSVTFDGIEVTPRETP